MNHLDYYRYYERLNNEPHFCPWCGNECDDTEPEFGNVTDENDVPLCQDCAEEE